MRRRQRSVRLVTAVVLLVAATALVALAALSGSFAFLAPAALLGVALGAAATRITHLELLQSRRDAARDRARTAREYRDLTEERIDEQLLFAADMSGRLARQEATVGRLEERLAEATDEVVRAHRALAETRSRLERTEDRADTAGAELARTRTRLADAEERAALSIVRVAELEQELEVALAHWQAPEVARKHA